ncbi:MAG: hypothetical protein Q7S33_05310 [Nanoarchaeota archaeon]|nr:hypothetical protein [Nanoarchaeota archaeon]
MAIDKPGFYKFDTPQEEIVIYKGETQDNNFILHKPNGTTYPIVKNGFYDKRFISIKNPEEKISELHKLANWMEQGLTELVLGPEQSSPKSTEKSYKSFTVADDPYAINHGSTLNLGIPNEYNPESLLKALENSNPTLNLEISEESNQTFIGPKVPSHSKDRDYGPRIEKKY